MNEYAISIRGARLTNKNDPKVLANFINCLSILENDTYLLYKSLSTKVEAPLIKTMLFSIAVDSQKHSTLLKGVADSISKVPEKPKNCEKNTGEVWKLVASLRAKIDAKKIYPEEEMLELSQKLTFLESIIGEEYYMFVQMKTLDLMMKEINQIYNLDLSGLKSIFTHIINDEEHHREIIGTIQKIIAKQTVTESNPLVKYTNPDNWISSS